MADPIPTRETRRIWPTAGVGGYLDVAWPDKRYDYTLFAGETQPGRIEVCYWRIEHLFNTVELPASGNFGAMTVRRLATGFRYEAEIILPFGHQRAGADEVQETNPGGKLPNLSQPFIEDRLQGAPLAAFGVAVKFQLGDPERIGPDAKGAWYYCSHTQLESITPVNPSKPPFDVVRAIVRGKGSAPLRRYVEDVLIGVGGFGIGYE